MFSKKPGNSPGLPATNPVASKHNSTFSVIGADVAIKGDIHASADLHVDGKVEGDIICTSLVQGESSEVHGAVQAESARLAGRVTGSITVRELVILKSARIEGDVNYDALTIEQGAEVEGRFAHSVPNRRAADKPAAATGEDPVLTLAN
jgi:cytoskeletal protein CcmA (bactofilin family)